METQTLFDVEPFTSKLPRLSPRLRPDVRFALESLKRTLDGLPKAELQKRRESYEASQRGQGSHSVGTAA